MVEFNRLELLKAVECAVESFDHEADAKLAQEMVEYDKAKAAWMDKFGPQWQDALPKLREKLKKGHPITEKDLPRRRDGFDRVAVFGERMPVRREVMIPRELANLQAVLHTIHEDTVTTGGLRSCGVPPRALSEALRCFVPPKEKK